MRRKQRSKRKQGGPEELQVVWNVQTSARIRINGGLINIQIAGPHPQFVIQ